MDKKQSINVCPLDQKASEQLAELFRALSDPSRLRIIAVLAQRELHVGGLATAINLSESAVSHHLRQLRQMHLVRIRKSGRQVFYRLDDDHIAILYQIGLEHVLHG
jgi:ArsR family transcriptional regulator, lead/cadmium/zinc/bismuth-responsive transcriptional repressor